MHSPQPDLTDDAGGRSTDCLTWQQKELLRHDRRQHRTCGRVMLLHCAAQYNAATGRPSQSTVPPWRREGYTLPPPYEPNNTTPQLAEDVVPNSTDMPQPCAVEGFAPVALNRTDHGQSNPPRYHHHNTIQRAQPSRQSDRRYAAEHCVRDGGSVQQHMAVDSAAVEGFVPSAVDPMSDPYAHAPARRPYGRHQQHTHRRGHLRRPYTNHMPPEHAVDIAQLLHEPLPQPVDTRMTDTDAMLDSADASLPADAAMAEEEAVDDNNHRQEHHTPHLVTVRRQLSKPRQAERRFDRTFNGHEECNGAQMVERDRSVNRGHGPPATSDSTDSNKDRNNTKNDVKTLAYDDAEHCSCPSDHKSFPRRRPTRQSRHQPRLDVTEQACTQQQQQQEPPAVPEPCVVCCEPLAVVSVGPCGHAQVCGRCCLRLRLNYKDLRCPLCKAEQPEVILARWRPALPSFEEYQSDYGPRTLRRMPRHPGLLVDSWTPRVHPTPPQLANEIKRITSYSCPVCDRKSLWPFRFSTELLQHMDMHHAERLCHICVLERRMFVLELPLYAEEAALAAHIQESHPLCAFCDVRFHGTDELHAHMVAQHFSCHLCEQAGLLHQFFPNAHELECHLQANHFVCEDADCQGCLVAFSTQEDLQQHRRLHHGAGMARWEPRRARPVALEFSVERARRPLRAQRSASPELLAARQRQERPLRGPSPLGVAPASHGDGGWRMVDDDVGMRESSDEAFPAISSTVGGEAEPAGPSRSWPQLASPTPAPLPTQATPSKFKALRSVTVKCPCGRKSRVEVVAEGQDVTAPACDATCRTDARRRQLANAFGIGDPDAYISSFAQTRNVAWPPTLVLAARAHLTTVKAVELELGVLLLEKQMDRLDVQQPLSREQRRLVHEMVEVGYGMVSSSRDLPGGGRQLTVRKLRGTTAQPRVLLSATAARMTDVEAAAIQARAAAHCLRLTDVAPTVDVCRLLRDWDGQFALEDGREGEVVVAFNTAAARQAVVARFGGGVRGQFRLQMPADQGARPSTPPPEAPVAQGLRLSADAAFGEDAAAVDAAKSTIVPASLVDDWEDAVGEAPATVARPRNERGEDIVDGGQWAILAQVCSD